MTFITYYALQAANLFAQAGGPAAQCDPGGGGFFSIPKWYKYLAGVQATNPSTGKTECNVAITSINSVWLIGAAILEILLRLGALASLAMIVYAGIMFIQSEGQPDKTRKALNTVIYACIGLAITVSATVAITFIGGRFN